MSFHRFCITLAGGALLVLLPAVQTAPAAQPDWQSWSPQVFEQAKRQGRLVFLDVQAQWCLACRRMDAAAFRDPRVLDTLRQRYIPVRADFDREPGIARRYGVVPTLAILNGDGIEIIRRHGYLESNWLYWLLLAVADDPRPEAHR